jgi:hypothetical protein
MRTQIQPPAEDMPMVPGVPGWTPDFRMGYDQSRAQADRLKALRGRQVTGTWVALSAGVRGRDGQNRWWPDLPVILQLEDEQQLEVCWDLWDRLSISWDTIEVSAPPGGRLAEYALTWRQNGQPELSAIEGGVLTGLMGVENAYWGGTNITGPGDPDALDAEPTGWQAAGIWLRTSKADLTICAGADGNHLKSGSPAAERHWRPFALLQAAIGLKPQDPGIRTTPSKGQLDGG